MTRLLFLLGRIALTAYLIKKIYSDKPPEKAIESPLMRKCTHCSMHVPDNQAIQYKEYFFCSKAHQDEFLNDD